MLLQKTLKLPTPLMPEHESYRIAIENLAKSLNKRIFDNADPAHAAIVLGNIFKNSNDHVKIFAGDFNGAVSDNEYYLTSLKSYLNKNLPLTIVFQKTPNPDSLALGLIREYPNNKISIRKIKDGVIINNDQHFTVGDGRMFRLEIPGTNYKAHCSFNSPEIVKVLNGAFSVLYNNSEPFDQ